MMLDLKRRRELAFHSYTDHCKILQNSRPFGIMSGSNTKATSESLFIG